MSAQRFIRCKHCGMPHEAKATECPVTGLELLPEKKKSPASGEQALGPPRWEHSVHPLAEPLADDGVDAASMCGRVLDDKYRIDALIGRGGMGAVYRAENTRIGKQVAIKILIRGHVKGSEPERRFYREARIAGSIGHPNIALVFDLGTLENGAPYQVMELLEGQTLAERIRIEGALPIDDVLDCAESVLSALSAAHERGIVHRDLKPENLFLHRRGGGVITKLLDFGVSKSLTNDQTLSLTQTGMVVGTPYYLAPEQARGDRGVDHRVDLWAMGVVLYEALTGTLPFRADNYNALLQKILSTRPVPPRELRPRLPASIDEIVMRALAFEPADRFASAEEMLRVLRVLRTARGKRAASDPPSIEILPDVPSLAAKPTDTTLNDLRISQLQGADDPTEISDSFSFSDVENKSRT